MKTLSLKIGSLYHNNDPYLKPHRRLVWKPSLPIVLAILTGWIAVAWWAGKCF